MKNVLNKILNFMNFVPNKINFVYEEFFMRESSFVKTIKHKIDDDNFRRKSDTKIIKKTEMFLLKLE